MNLKKEFKILILPVLRGFPLLLTFMVLAFCLAQYAIRYMVPIYEASASIKLDNRELESGDYTLFDDGTSASTGSNFLTEVELFKSKSLREKVLNNLDFDVSYYRVGKVKRIELYRESPFILDYRMIDSSLYDKSYFLYYKGDGKFRMYADAEKNQYLYTLTFNKVYADSNRLSLRVRPNLTLLREKPEALRVGDFFEFKINATPTLVAGVDKSNFFVRPVDKEIYIVKLHYKNEVPEKAAAFLNELIRVYIETDQENKTAKASKTLEFIDRELDRIGDEMTDASRRLASYRKKHEIVNPKQETESILRQLNQYDINKIAIDLEEIELRNVHEFLKSDLSLTGFSPNFEAIKDDVFKNTFLQLKNMEIEKIELSKKYPETSLEMRTINRKINELKDFVTQSIDKKLINAEEKRSEIGASIDELQSRFKSYPGKERKLAMLQREFMLKEETYNYLTKRRMELSINSSADQPLHQVVDYAVVPKKPVSPNKALITGAAVFLSIIVSLILIYILNFFFATIRSVEDITDELDLPVIGTVNKQRKRALDASDPVLNLYTNIANLEFFEGRKMITVSSGDQNEGKTFIAERLGRLLASYGKRVLLIDMNFKTPRLKNIFAPSKTEEAKTNAPVPSANFPQPDFMYLAEDGNEMPSSLLFAPQTALLLSEMKNNYDVVLIDTAATSQRIDAAAAMRLSDLNLMVLRKGKSRVHRLKKHKAFLDAYNLENIHCVLNGTN